MHKDLFIVSLCVVASLLLPTHLHAQHSSSDTTASQAITAPNAIFLELGGNCLFGSINYDRRLNETYAVRLGVCPYMTFGAQSDFLIGTVLVNAMLTHRATHIQVGVGATVIMNKYQPLYDTSPLFGINNNTVTQNGLRVIVLPTADFGFRYQPRDRGMFAQLDFTPLLSLDGSDFSNAILFWGGFSIGFTF
ncbi:MAG TPA: hypothetical protein VFJ29_06320 [Candidatus Kapabacteria bacterium]|nr:hypothetical protein [Candidatus Kapabacteria bacterium]